MYVRMYMYMCVRVYVNKHDSAKTVHSIELQFDMYITDHRWTNTIDYDEGRTYSSFYRSTKNNSLDI